VLDICFILYKIKFEKSLKLPKLKSAFIHYGIYFESLHNSRFVKKIKKWSKIIAFFFNMC